MTLHTSLVRPTQRSRSPENQRRNCHQSRVILIRVEPFVVPAYEGKGQDPHGQWFGVIWGVEFTQGEHTYTNTKSQILGRTYILSSPTTMVA